MEDKNSQSQITRRKMLKLTTGGLLGIPFIGVTANHSWAAFNNTRWATGGTQSLQNISYKNPLLDGDLGSICKVARRTTEGPCYATTQVRKDISEGRDGLPVRLWFKIVDEACEPIKDARVDIWHCDPLGVYSGDDMRSVRFCTGGDKEATAHDWFRGIQTTDENGLVSFETCFPGWYPRRTVHIHLIISKGGDSLTTQVGFDDALTESILTNEEIYVDRGAADTTNSTDSVFPRKDNEEFLMNIKRLSDNSMLAWKTLSMNF